MALIESGENWGVKLENVHASFAHVAQLAEHILGKDEVNSSILFMGSILRKRKYASPKS